MLTMNKATLLGYAGRNPEMRKLPSGDDVAEFSLATTERFRRRDDTVAESTEWHRIVAFGPAAEAVRKLVRKGVPVLVEGRIVTRSWIDRTTGAERRATEIVVAGRRSLVNVLTRGRRDTGGNGAAGQHGDGAAGSAGDPVGEAATPPGEARDAAQEAAASPSEAEETASSEAVEAADADGPSDDHGQSDDGGPSDDRE